MATWLANMAPVFQRLLPGCDSNSWRGAMNSGLASQCLKILFFIIPCRSDLLTRNEIRARNYKKIKQDTVLFGSRVKGKIARCKGTPGPPKPASACPTD